MRNTFLIKQIQLDKDQQLLVEPGDYFGFSWYQGGIVVYADSSSHPVCHSYTVPSEGDLVEYAPLGRMYSIKINVCGEKKNIYAILKTDALYFVSKLIVTICIPQI